METMRLSTFYLIWFSLKHTHILMHHNSLKSWTKIPGFHKSRIETFQCGTERKREKPLLLVIPSTKAGNKPQLHDPKMCKNYIFVAISVYMRMNFEQLLSVPHIFSVHWMKLYANFIRWNCACTVNSKPENICRSLLTQQHRNWTLNKCVINF